jgi:hypothetical protein
VDLFLHSPIRLNGVVLNWISTGTLTPGMFKCQDSDYFFYFAIYKIDLILPAALALGSTQPLTEMSTRNL